MPGPRETEWLDEPLWFSVNNEADCQHPSPLPTGHIPQAEIKGKEPDREVGILAFGLETSMLPYV